MTTLQSVMESEHIPAELAQVDLDFLDAIPMPKHMHPKPPAMKVDKPKRGRMNRAHRIGRTQGVHYRRKCTYVANTDGILKTMIDLYDGGHSPNLVFKVKPLDKMIHFERLGMANRYRELIDGRRVVDAIASIVTRPAQSMDKNQQAKGVVYTCRKMVAQMQTHYYGEEPPLSIEWVGLTGLEEPSRNEEVLMCANQGF